jgi:hypothetical protein
MAPASAPATTQILTMVKARIIAPINNATLGEPRSKCASKIQAFTMRTINWTKGEL